MEYAVLPYWGKKLKSSLSVKSKFKAQSVNADIVFWEIVWASLKRSKQQAPLMFTLFDVSFNLNGKVLPSSVMCGWCDLIPGGAEWVIAMQCPENVYFAIKIKQVW